MEVFIPWLHRLSKLDIFSCINNIWNFSLVIISCWFLKGVLRCWSLSQSFQLFWIFSAFEWKSWNSFRWGCMCVQECVIVYYIKLLKHLQMSDTFWSQKAIAFCARDRGAALRFVRWWKTVLNMHETQLTTHPLVFSNDFCHRLLLLIHSVLLIWKDWPESGCLLLLQHMLCCVIYFKSSLSHALTNPSHSTQTKSFWSVSGALLL